MCFGGGCAPLFLLFFRESKKKNEHAKKMNKKRRDFLCTKGGQVVTYLFLYYRSTGVTHTHKYSSSLRAKQRERRREREAERREALFFIDDKNTTTMRQQKRFFVDHNKGVVFSLLLFFVFASLFSLTVVNAFESPAKASLKAFEVVTFSKVETTRATKSSLTSSPDDDTDEKITAVEFTAFGTHFRVNVEQSYKKFLKNGALFVDQLNGKRIEVDRLGEYARVGTREEMLLRR